MIPERIGVKYFVENPAEVELSALIPVFHRWIQKRAIEGLLIDVADYEHVYQGPGIMLIAHEGDYSLDMGNGRPGLLYKRKRDLEGDLSERLHTVFRLAFIVSQMLEAEPSLKIRFHYDEAELTFFDRLYAPNKPEAFKTLREDMRAFLTEIHGDDVGIQLEHISADPREPLKARVQISGAFDREHLRNQLLNPALIVG